LPALLKAFDVQPVIRQVSKDRVYRSVVSDVDNTFVSSDALTHEMRDDGPVLSVVLEDSAKMIARLERAYTRVPPI